MKITMVAGKPALVDAEDFRNLSATNEMKDNTRFEESSGYEQDASGNYLWLSCSELRKLAGNRDTSWHEQFNHMIGFAEKRGWVEEGRVRVHIEES